MATTKDRALLRQLGTLFNLGTIRDLTDGQLLERFARGDGEPAELAFAALVERHGAMVLGVCRSQSLDPNDAQDAFQATFLVLVEKASGLWVRDSLGPWLHGVALRTAACARSAEIRRKRLERRAAEVAANRADDDPDADERSRLLHEEIERLPERYRVPIVLCDLEGRTCEEAARVLGRPAGTIKSWRARGRECLRRRLIRAGLAPAAAIEMALAPDAARAAVLRATATQAAHAAARILSDRMAAGMVPATVSLLVKGVIRTMFYRQLRTVFAAICAVGVAGGGFASVALVAADDPKGGTVIATAAIPGSSPPRPLQIFETSKALSGEAWPMTLRDAVRCALDSGTVVRVVTVGDAAPGTVGPPPIGILRVKYETTDARFQSEVMAQVRSAEQQYWNLAQAYVQLWASERAANLAQEIYNREQAELLVGRGTRADVAEAAQRLEQFNLDLVTRTSDVMTTERGLRNILGLPEQGRRRIIPITPPTEGHLEPDWEKSLAAMLANQPDVRQARDLLEAAEKLAGIGNDSGAPADVSKPVRPDPLVERRKDHLKQVTGEATHSLLRFFLEINSNYKQFQTARRLRIAAAQRVDAQRAYYSEGRITIDRYLDAVGGYAHAVATESQYLSTYNISIVALEEAKGTLLDYDKIVVTNLPGAATQAAGRPEVASPGTTPPPRPKGDRKPGAAGTTYSFDFTIGRGPQPIQIRGSFTVSPARDER